jgi:hypothetical protein
MKTRQGFVSNSSSSSFIIIGGAVDDGTISLIKDYLDDKENLVVNGDKGEGEFGWGPDKITDFWSRLNFAWIQADMVKKEHPEWPKMLNQVLKDTLGVKKIYWNITTDWQVKNKRHVYIDHQSCSYEGMNTEMFDSKDALYHFLFSDGSYIQLDNDNH